MIIQRWGFSVVPAAIVGVGIGVLLAVLGGGSGPRVVIGTGVGLIIGGGLLAIFDRVIIRRRDASTRAVIYEKLTEPVVEGDVTVTPPAIPAFDPETGEPLRPTRSRFLGLLLEVWSLILVGCGILLVGVGVVMYLAS